MAEYKPYELRDILSASKLAESRMEEMVKLIEAANQMSWFDLVADSKVSKKDKSIFRWFSLKASDPQRMVTEIEKHERLFDKMRKAILKAKNNDEDADEALEELLEEFFKVYRDSEISIDSDDGRLIGGLHEKFVAQRHMVENSIIRTQIANTRRQLRDAKDGWRKAVEEVRQLTAEMERALENNTDLRAKFEKLLTVNEQVMIHQQELMDENAGIRMLLEEMMGEDIRKSHEIGNMEEKLEALKIENQQLKTQNQQLITEKGELAQENRLIQTQLQNLQDAFKNMTMILQAPTNGFNDASQVQDFAEQNCMNLELFTLDDSCSPEEISEMKKYQDFFKATERVAGLLCGDTEGADVETKELSERLSTLTKEAMEAMEAMMKRDRGTSSVLYCLYEDFIAQRNQLRRMVCVLRFILRKKQNDATRQSNQT